MKQILSVFVWLLCAVFFPVSAQDNILLAMVDGRQITVGEYRAYCKYCQVPENDRTSLDDFIVFKLKSMEASRMGCDTLADFRRMHDAFSAKVRQMYAPVSGGIRIQRGGWARVEILTLPVRQDAGPDDMNRARVEMQMVRRNMQPATRLCLLEGKEGYHYRDGLQWVAVDWLMPEEADAVRCTVVGELSDVFESAVGMNLLRVIDKTDDYSRTKDNVCMDDAPTTDILLTMCWDRLFNTLEGEEVEKKILADFFKKHKKDYAFDLPHYKGVVVHCWDKDDAKVIKQRLKKISYDEWPERIAELEQEGIIRNAKSEYGLFRIGTNDAIDCLVFKCIDYPLDDEYPYIFVKGKVLKKGPERFEDIADRVMDDYLKHEGVEKIKALKKAHVVEFTKEGLSAVRIL